MFEAIIIDSRDDGKPEPESTIGDYPDATQAWLAIASYLQACHHLGLLEWIVRCEIRPAEQDMLPRADR